MSFFGGGGELLFLVKLLRIVIYFVFVSGSRQHLMSCDIIFNG